MLTPVHKLTIEQLEAMISYHTANVETFERNREPRMANEFRELVFKYKTELEKRFR